MHDEGLFNLLIGVIEQAHKDTQRSLSDVAPTKRDQVRQDAQAFIAHMQSEYATRKPFMTEVRA